MKHKRIAPINQGTKRATAEPHETPPPETVPCIGKGGTMIETHGWITPLAGKVVHFLTWPSRKIIGYRSGSVDEVKEASWNAKRVDSFVAGCFFLELVSFLAVTLGAGDSVRDAALFFCAWRVIDLIANAARMTLFKMLFEPNATVASNIRVVVLGLMNYLDLCICFAVFYAAVPFYIHSSEKWDWFSPLYFSAVTQLTIGYGDLYPTGPARALAAIQASVGVILIVLLISRFVSVMKPIRSLSTVDVSKINNRDTDKP